MTSTFQKTTSNVLPLDVAKFHSLSPSELPLAPGQWSESAPERAWSNVLDAAYFAVPKEWQDDEYRHAAMEGIVEGMIAWQVRVNREERGMTQAQLARLMSTGQSAISKLEDPEGGDVQLSTLVRAAHAFDCALVVRFVDHQEFVAQTSDVRPERLLAASFCALEKRPNIRKSSKKTLTP